MPDNSTIDRPVALVTGASYGIGGATALAFARAGYDLAIAARQLDHLAETAEQVGAAGARVLPIAVDVTDQNSVESAMAAALREFGKADVLVNNAGVPLRKPALEITRAEWTRVIDVNLTGAFFMAQQMGHHLIATGRTGCIVNMASVTGLVGRALSSAYGTSKGGMIQMTRMLAIEWAGNGIRVNAIAPASTVTPTRRSLTDPAKRDVFLSKIPLGRFGTAEEMAAAAVYLASPEGSFITGQTLALDGGLTAC